MMKKHVMPISKIAAIQFAIFAVSIIISMGYAYKVVQDVDNMFDVSNAQTEQSFQLTEAILTKQVPFHTKLLHIRENVLLFRYVFERLTMDPNENEDAVRQAYEKLVFNFTELKQFSDFSEFKNTEMLRLMQSLNILIEIAEELLITTTSTNRLQLYEDTLLPLEDISLSIINSEKRFQQKNVDMRYDLEAQIEQTEEVFIEFHVQTKKLQQVFIITSLIILCFPGIVQFLFFRVLKNRLQLLENFADNIAKEKFTDVPFIAKDKTGKLAIALSLMGERIRQLLHLSRQESSRADQALKEVEHLAYYDPLTGLENRRMFYKHLDIALAQVKQQDISQNQTVLLFLDLDNFKDVNDSMGHDVGDELLKTMADSLKQITTDKCHLARLGGDEFAVLAYGQCDNGVELAQKLNQQINQPISIRGQEIPLSVSIGITTVSKSTTTKSILLRQADMAMYRAKDQGRNTHQHFTDDMYEKAHYTLSLSRELSSALKNEQFEVYYQAKININSGSITGAEALIRWNHPSRGIVGAGEFIPIVEGTGLIQEISNWVLEKACRDGADLVKQGTPTKIAVNISAIQFYGSTLVEQVAETLKTTNFPPQLLELELTEGILLDDVQHAKSIIHKLHDLGVSIALDDFGTGYSSFNYLRQLPIDVLKIDRSFISNMLGHKKDKAIIKTIIELGQMLEMEVVAEGIETIEEFNYLSEVGCDTAQGFLFARPVPLADFQKIRMDVFSSVTKL